MLRKDGEGHTGGKESSQKSRGRECGGSGRRSTKGKGIDPGLPESIIILGVVLIYS